MEEFITRDVFCSGTDHCHGVVLQLELPRLLLWEDGLVLTATAVRTDMPRGVLSALMIQQ